MTNKKEKKPKFEIIREHLRQELKIFQEQELRMTVELEENKKLIEGAEKGLITMRRLISQIEQFLKDGKSGE